MAIAPLASPANRVARHITLLAVLWIARGALHFLGAAGAFVAGRFILPRILPSFPLAGLVEASLAISTGVLVIGGAACLATGLGLMQRESWGRPLALVMGFLALLSVPFGTALGIYTLWVLLPAPADTEYRRMSRAA